MVGRDGFFAWRVMRDDQGFLRVALSKLVLQPASGGYVHHQGILRLKRLAARLDDMEIPHHPPRRQHCSVEIVPELEVRPQRAAQKGKVPNLDRRIFQQMNIAASGGGSELLKHPGNRTPVELMVSHDINDGLVSGSVLSPIGCPRNRH